MNEIIDFIDVLKEQVCEDIIFIDTDECYYTIVTKGVAKNFPKIFFNYSNELISLEKELIIKQVKDGVERETPFFFFNNKGEIDLLGSMIFVYYGHHYKNHGIDSFGRFDFKNTDYYKKGLFKRMLYEEYLYFFCSQFNLDYKKQNSSVILTCDVDRPLSRMNTFGQLVKSLGADLIFRKSPNLFFKRLLCNILPINNGGFFLDPFNTYRYFIELKNKFNLDKLIFFLLVSTNENQKNIIDRTLSLHSKEYKSIFKVLDKENINFGLHPSYTSSKIGAKQLNEESILLKNQRLESTFKISRAHYLIYNDNYLKNLVDIDYTDDYSLGSEYFMGFTNGTCRPVHIKLKKKKITLHNLAFMDVVYFKDKLKSKAELDVMINEYKLWGGEFVLLWHNNYLQTSLQKNELESIIEKVLCAV